MFFLVTTNKKFQVLLLKEKINSQPNPEGRSHGGVINYYYLIIFWK